MASICTGPSHLDWGCLYAGDRNRQPLEFLADGDPWDLTGATITAQARRSAPDPAIALTAHVHPVDPALGRFDVAWDGEDVRALLAGAETWNGVWDLQVLEPGEELPITVVRGAVSAEMDVTREEGKP